MRRIRFTGIILTTATILAVCAASVAGIRGQAAGTDRQIQPPRGLALAAAPNVQVLLSGGPEIGVTIRDGDKGEGVVVSEVRSDSPASKGGVKSGDIIAEFDGEKVRSTRQLTRLVQETPAGRSVKVAVMREGKRLELTVTPEARSSGVGSRELQADAEKLRQTLRDQLREGGDLSQLGGDTFWFGSPGSGIMGTFVQPGVRLGVTVQDTTPQLAAYFGAKEGVLVTSVTEGSAAAKAGLKAGDVITAVNDKGVASSSDLVRLLRAAGSDAEVAIALVRDRRAMTVKAKLESPASRPPRAISRTIVV